jgi:hypothetical protein
VSPWLFLCWQNIRGKLQAVNHKGTIYFKNVVFNFFFRIGWSLGDHDTAFKDTGLNVFGRFESGAEPAGRLNRKVPFF